MFKPRLHPAAGAGSAAHRDFPAQLVRGGVFPLRQSCATTQDGGIHCFRILTPAHRLPPGKLW